MGKSFQKVKLCHTNDFPANKNDKIKNWVENNGGTYHQDLRSDTTHLVCSKRAWKSYIPIIRDARRRNRTLPKSKKIKIVNLEWLEDSLTSKNRRPLDSSKYLYEQRRLRAFTPDTSGSMDIPENDKIPKKKAVAIDRKMGEFEKEIEDLESIMGSINYHPFVDSTGFPYLIVLARRDVIKNVTERHKIKVGESSSPSDLIHGNHVPPSSIQHAMFPKHSPLATYSIFQAAPPPRFRPKSSNRVLRVPILNPWAYCLQLFESDAVPHKYACYLSYTSGRAGVKREVEPLAPEGSTWEFTWGIFRKIFKLKTGIDWAERPKWNPVSQDRAWLSVDGDEGVKMRRFEYVAPRTEQPFGLRDIVANSTNAQVPEKVKFEKGDETMNTH